MDTLQSKVNGLCRAAFLTARTRHCLSQFPPTFVPPSVRWPLLAGLVQAFKFLDNLEKLRRYLRGEIHLAAVSDADR